MNSIILILCIGVAFFVLQSIFFITCMRWLASGKRKRDKEFSILDSDRAKLIEMQSKVRVEINEAKKLADETLNKLRIIGTEAHAEWEDVTKKINTVLVEVDNQSEKLLDNNMSKLNMQIMSLEKTLINAEKINTSLLASMVKAKKIIKLFDTGLPTDEILKEIQFNKYAEAKKMLVDGVDASMISKQLGMSMGEIVLLSSMT